MWENGNNMEGNFGKADKNGTKKCMAFLYRSGRKKKWKRWCASTVIFFDAGKTERECVTQIVKEAEAFGYRNLEEILAKGEKVEAGQRVYAVGMKR